MYRAVFSLEDIDAVKVFVSQRTLAWQKIDATLVTPTKTKPRGLMEITARNAQNFFRCSFSESQVVAIGSSWSHDVCLADYGGLGTCDRPYSRPPYRYTRYDRAIDPYLPTSRYLAETFCELLECDGVIFIRSSGSVYTWFRNEPVQGTRQLEPTEPLHMNGVEVSVDWKPQEKTLEEVTQNPNLSLASLCWLSESYPRLVAQNPIIPLLLLENPTVYQQFPEALQRAILAH
jgi:hypothetical protein